MQSWSESEISPGTCILNSKTINIAGISVKISFREDLFPLFSSINDFESSKKEKFSTEIDIIECRDTLDCNLRQILYTDKSSKDGKNDFRVFTSYGWRTVIDIENFKTTIFCCSGYEKKAIGASLGYFCCLRFPKENLVFFHAASCLLEGKAYIFPALSGKGKTNLSRNIAGTGEILNDEFSCVEIMGDNYIAHGTPFGQITNGPLNGELKKIFFLEKWDRDEFTRISPIEAVKRAWNDSLYRTQLALPRERKIVFGNMFDMFKSIPCYEMRVRKNFNDFGIFDKL